LTPNGGGCGGKISGVPLGRAGSKQPLFKKEVDQKGANRQASLKKKLEQESNVRKRELL